MLSARERLQAAYDDGYADTDLDRDEWNERWLRDHPDAPEVVVYERTLIDFANPGNATQREVLA